MLQISRARQNRVMATFTRFSDIQRTSWNLLLPLLYVHLFGNGLILLLYTLNPAYGLMTDVSCSLLAAAGLAVAPEYLRDAVASERICKLHAPLAIYSFAITCCAFVLTIWHCSARILRSPVTVALVLWSLAPAWVLSISDGAKTTLGHSLLRGSWSADFCFLVAFPLLAIAIAALAFQRCGAKV